MKVATRSLARLELVYSIAQVPELGSGVLPAFAAGSEGGGELYFFRPPRFVPELIANAPGGFMSICSIAHAGRAFLVASTDFKPIFQGAGCRLIAYPLDRGELPEPLDIAPLPYTHRLSTCRVGKTICLLASTLCGGKDSQDDWSSPGGVYAAGVPLSFPGESVVWRFRSVCGGLSKNHGMDAVSLYGGLTKGFLLSAHEGLFYLEAPDVPDSQWRKETIALGEHSDACAYPWDDPDSSQVFSLSPFHGNQLSIHRQTRMGWQRETLDDSIEMGHVLWAGIFLGKPGIIVGGRAGKKELVLYRHGEGTSLSRRVIDDGIGPTQMAVVELGGGKALLIVAAHARNEVLLYEVEE